ncbi:MAG TPA: OFA family MFS transporter [Pseudonocardia sp.]|jgi:MFS family permease|nr:OFA family MFS transporter [Pseudonocardia sp.]
MAESEDAGREVRDYYGRRYYLRDRAEDRAGREQAVWLAWPPMAAVGVLQYGFGAAVPALMDRNGWSLIGTFSVLAAWAVCQAGVAFPTAWLRERNRVAPRTVMLLGAVLCAVGLVALAHGPGLLGALVGYAVLGGAGAGLVYSTCSTSVGKWHPDRVGGKVSIVTGAFAYGAVPFAVAAVVRLTPANLPTALDVTAVLLFLVVAGFGVLFRDPPADWWPAAIDPKEWALRHAPGRRVHAPAVAQFSLRDALHTRTLPVMYLIVLAAGAVSLFNAAFLVVFAIEAGVAVGVVAVAAALLTGVNGAGRSVVMRLSDRLGRCRTLKLVLLVQAAGQLLLAVAASSGSSALLLAAAVVAGAGGGGFYPLFASLARDYFGDRRAPEVHAMVYSAKAFAGVLGVGLAALAVTDWGYPVTFVVAGALSFVSAGAIARLQRPGLPSTLPSVHSGPRLAG